LRLGESGTTSKSRIEFNMLGGVGGAALPPPTPGAPPAAPLATLGAAPGFAIMPGGAFAHAIIDYETREGITLYRSNTRCLYMDTSSLYDGNPEGYLGFLNSVQQCIREGNMEALFNVPIDLAAAVPDMRPFIANHGIFTLDHRRQFATPTLAANNRDTQDNFMMDTAILASLSPMMSNCININRQLYTIGAHILAILLLKVIIREAHLDSNSSTRFARASACKPQQPRRTHEVARRGHRQVQQVCLPAAGHIGCAWRDHIGPIAQPN
jgi:hypothetical protein